MRGTYDYDGGPDTARSAAGKRMVVCASPTGRDADLRFGSDQGDLIWSNLSYAWAHNLADAWNYRLERLEQAEPRGFVVEGEPPIPVVDW